MRTRLVRLLAFVLVTAIVSFSVWLTMAIYSEGRHKQAVRVVLPVGASVSEIAVLLNDAQVLSQPLVFELWARVLGEQRKLKAGEYIVPPRASLEDISRLIRSGQTVWRRLTVAEGLTSAKVVKLIATIEGLSGQIDTVPPEGTVLPETYFYSWGDSRAKVVRRMGLAMEQVLAKAWEGRSANLSIKSPREALILASIIEKETAVPEERARVAGVFHNRIRLGMRLQSDPTVSYGLAQQGEILKRPLNRSDLTRPTSYNTYLIKGLPPGPISNPGRASIEAALHPQESDEIYFVANGEGGHAFARTLKEHQRNVARWRKIRKRGK